jgi:hypothetical protein
VWGSLRENLKESHHRDTPYFCESYL